MEYEIREAVLGDEIGIIRLVKDLALYERAPEQVVNTAEALRVHLFEEKICAALVVIHRDEMIGFALFYTNYSTWKGKCLYLEDFYIQPEFRTAGIGSKLFDRVVSIARSRKVRRMDWQVLEWNQLAIDFYQRKHAVLDPEWVNGRLFFDYE